MYLLIYSQNFDRDPGIDYGRLSLNHLKKGTLIIWKATSATAGKQNRESFHKKGGLIPPQYRVPELIKNQKTWTVHTKPLPRPNKPGIEGNLYQITPYSVTTDKGGTRGDFGIHKDANVPGSLGCIVMSEDRFNQFEREIAKLYQQGIKEIPLFVQYS